MSTHEYAFDVTLNAVIRIKTDTEKAARRSILRVLDAARLNVAIRDGRSEVKITEISAGYDDPNEPFLFEMDEIMLDSEPF